ncbi:MAG: glycosyltransferase, partial [Thermoguttaceae bacterium]
MNILYIITKSQFCSFLLGQPAFMRERGFHVGVCSASGKELDEIALNENVEAFPIFMQREIAPIQDIISLWKLIRLMRRFKPTVVIAGTPKAGLLGMIAAFITRVPVRIYHLRGLRIETTHGLKHFIMTCTERLASGLSNRVWCVGKSLRDEFLKRKLGNPKKTITLNNGSSNGIDTRRFAWNAEVLAEAVAVAQQWNIASDEPVVCFVGRIVKDKGIVELAEAFRHL